jgi:hypothetical protein
MRQYTEARSVLAVMGRRVLWRSGVFAEENCRRGCHAEAALGAVGGRGRERCP